MLFRVYGKISIGTDSDTIKHEDYFHERYIERQNLWEKGRYRLTDYLKKRKSSEIIINLQLPQILYLFPVLLSSEDIKCRYAYK